MLTFNSARLKRERTHVCNVRVATNHTAHLTVCLDKRLALTATSAKNKCYFKLRCALRNSLVLFKNTADDEATHVSAQVFRMYPLLRRKEKSAYFITLQTTMLPIRHNMQAKASGHCEQRVTKFHIHSDSTNWHDDYVRNFCSLANLGPF